MTVRTLSRAATHYVGVSGDSKPTTGVQNGASFYETDTDATYVFIGGSWTQEAALAGGQTVTGAVTVSSGTVAVSSLPADPLGANADAAVAAGATGSISAKLRSLSRDLVANIVLAAGANRIGKVTVRNAANDADIDPLAVNSYVITCLGVQQRTISNSAVSITASSIPANTKRATIYVGGTAGQAVRVGNVATVPTASSGLKVVVGDYIDLSDPAMDASTLLADLRFIRADAADITLDVIFWS